MNTLTQLALSTLRGARKGFDDAVVQHWNGELCELDLAVAQKTARWWQRKLHDFIPQNLFILALFECMAKHSSRSDGAGPAYGTRGKFSGLRCTEKEMGPPLSEYNLPRMVRTKGGRTLLQSDLLKERQCCELDTDGDGDCPIHPPRGTDESPTAS